MGLQKGDCLMIQAEGWWERCAGQMGGEERERVTWCGLGISLAPVGEKPMTCKRLDYVEENPAGWTILLACGGGELD